MVMKNSLNYNRAMSAHKFFDLRKKHPKSSIKAIAKIMGIHRSKAAGYQYDFVTRHPPLILPPIHQLQEIENAKITQVERDKARVILAVNCKSRPSLNVIKEHLKLPYRFVNIVASSYTSADLMKAKKIRDSFRDEELFLDTDITELDLFEKLKSQYPEALIV